MSKAKPKKHNKHKNPWEEYERLKRIIKHEVLTPLEYERRIADLLRGMKL